jgi:glycosyltransferase involved in cell wall biosynthesis
MATKGRLHQTSILSKPPRLRSVCQSASPIGDARFPPFNIKWDFVNRLSATTDFTNRSRRSNKEHPMNDECVSLIICTYNQEHCVAEAIQSAFSQTYSPLEIIISDDCSTDGTFNVIQKEISKYSGNHRVWINRNNVNLGIGRHWDHISRKALARLVVHFAGDDISLPNRVEVVVLAWKSIQPTPYLLSSNGVIMTSSGIDLKPVKNIAEGIEPLVQLGSNNWDFDQIDIPVCGFALAVDKRLYESFRKIETPMWSEDEILRSRALLLGSIAFIPEVLVRYRDGGLSKGALPLREKYLNLHRNQTLSRTNYLEQLRNDFYSIGVPPRAFLHLTSKKLASAQRRLQMVETPNFFYSLLMLVAQLLLSKNEGVSKSDYRNMFFVRWFPGPFFRHKIRCGSSLFQMGELASTSPAMR